MLKTTVRTYNDRAYTSPQLFWVNFSTFAFLFNFFYLLSKETIKVLGIGAVFA